MTILVACREAGNMTLHVRAENAAFRFVEAVQLRMDDNMLAVKAQPHSPHFRVLSSCRVTRREREKQEIRLSQEASECYSERGVFTRPTLS